MTREEAIKLGESEWWIGKTDLEIVLFQLNEDLMTCPFGLFQDATSGVLGRPVWTHEFGSFSSLRDEVTEVMRVSSEERKTSVVDFHV